MLTIFYNPRYKKAFIERLAKRINDDFNEPCKVVSSSDIEFYRLKYGSSDNKKGINLFTMISIEELINKTIPR